jgi:hypothetical protein
LVETWMYFYVNVSVMDNERASGWYLAFLRVLSNAWIWYLLITTTLPTVTAPWSILQSIRMTQPILNYGDAGRLRFYRQ